MIARAVMLTTSVMANNTRPDAISAPCPTSPASPNRLAMFAAMVLPPGPRKSKLTAYTLPSVSASAMVSPSARPRPSMTEAMMPGRPYGKTAVRIISHFVAPSASAASSLADGVCWNTSRDSEVTIGSTMIASTIEPSRTDLPYGPLLANTGSQPACVCSQVDRSVTGPTK